MVDLALLQSVSYIAGALGVCVAAAYYVINMRTTLQTRQAQLFMQIFDRWCDPTFAKMYGDYRYNVCAKANNDPQVISKISIQALFGSFNPEVWVPIHTLAQYFEGISILVQKGLIDIDLVERLLSGRIIWYWEASEPFAKYTREKVGDPTMYNGIETLATELKKRAASNQSGK
jgi:hypothetical protein